MNLEDKLKHYRLNSDEYETMKNALGHEPNNIEWAVYSALWSEHCSYKSSKVHLKKLYTKNHCVVQGPGENAGVIDIGGGEKVAFKMESHNHPSFIEPFQGAATGVGGILRDIFTMGARPIATMDYLCFGEPQDEMTPTLLKGVVKGISFYGNCVGVPNLGGQTTFNKSYNKNNLVNAFALGLYRPGEEIFYGTASGVGNIIVYVGARTGRDGVHGAAMASESFDDDMEKKKPNVQIGDPFFEKLLIEACLEVMKEKLVVGIQDMGAAGLTSSTFEMASRAGSGLKMDLKKVPLREPDITPEEILLSESQERMILVIKKENYERVAQIFQRWDLSCAQIGEITDGNNVDLYWGDELLASLDHKPLVESAPVYERPFDLPEEPKGSDIPSMMFKDEEVLSYLKSVGAGSRSWITGQYDSTVGTRTLRSGEDDGVGMLYLRDSKRVLGMATGCRPLVMDWHAGLGAQDAIALPVLQLASRGVRALAVTDCLNFGNPEKPAIMGQFVSSLQNMDKACRAFDVPIIGGNVSLYNETLGESIISTPSTGIVGVGSRLDGPLARTKSSNYEIYLVSNFNNSLWLGDWQKSHGLKPQGKVSLHLEELVDLQETFLKLSSFAEASQVVGAGGVLKSLVKLCRGGVGARIDCGLEHHELVAERFYGALWVINPEDKEKFNKVISEKSEQLEVEKLGATGGSKISIEGVCDLSLEDINRSYNQGVGQLVKTMA